MRPISPVSAISTQRSRGIDIIEDPSGVVRNTMSVSERVPVTPDSPSGSNSLRESEPTSR